MNFDFIIKTLKYCNTKMRFYKNQKILVFFSVFSCFGCGMFSCCYKGTMKTLVQGKFVGSALICATSRYKLGQSSNISTLQEAQKKLSEQSSDKARLFDLSAVQILQEELGIRSDSEAQALGFQNFEDFKSGANWETLEKSLGITSDMDSLSVYDFSGQANAEGRYPFRFWKGRSIEEPEPSDSSQVFGSAFSLAENRVLNYYDGKDPKKNVTGTFSLYGFHGDIIDINRKHSDVFFPLIIELASSSLCEKLDSTQESKLVWVFMNPSF